ncbi:hypothetical protein nbrc107696_43610 [Gordonia spumicola]|uniref:Uncharacterized protein n=1 Tax=Gordonia spumicola TaxID=589161 RepID=A0A7I9VF38_9ACTN|nr:hypothetical protein [Gordonia spumicola]GEE03915.1 hypothetical protein nbrc107696_43610 [Gordonia spumicola]
MPSWILVLFTALLIVSVILLKVSRGNGPAGGFGAPSASRGWADGTLTVTSAASGAMDRNGERTCTVTGMIVGPGAAAVEVYGRVVLPSGATQPRTGEEIPVVYKPGKEESTWRFGTLSDSVG